MKALSVFFLSTFVLIVLACNSKRQDGGIDSASRSELNHRADSIVHAQISFLDSVLAGHFSQSEDYPLNRIEGAMEFMEKLSGVLSEADGNWAGRFAPVRQDLRHWKNWYTVHQQCLFVDSLTGTKVYVDTSCVTDK